MRVKKPATPTSQLRWLIPGMGLKRWLLLLVLGASILGLGLIYSLVVLYRSGFLPLWLYRALTLQFLPTGMRAVLAVCAGLLVIGGAAYGLSRSVISPFMETKGAALADVVYEYRRRERGPRIVAIGGGTGLATLLRGLKRHTHHLTAIVTVADDGGSSGRVRRELGLPPPGDFRNCIAALADDEALTTQLWQYRFGFTADGAQDPATDLAGHSFGNLFIAAMAGITGSFETALEQSSRVLAIQGRILPSTLANVTLVAEVREQQVRRVTGESHIPQSQGAVGRVYLTPENAPAYPEAVRAILTADLVVLGPGSLYTSLIPNLLIRGIREALSSTRAPVVFVCNVANQPGETNGYATDDYLKALERHIGRGVVDVMLVNSAMPQEDTERPVRSAEHTGAGQTQVVEMDLVDWQKTRMHDSAKLAKAVLAQL